MASLNASARTLIADAEKLLHDLADGLRPELLERTGSTATTMKGDGTPVTDADVEVNERIAEAIREQFPRHAVLSEELDTSYAGAEWTWIVDPIDGTSNFTTGVPYWCVSVALALEGEPVLGFVDSPPLAARFVAVAGEGATKNGAPNQVRAPVDFDNPENRHVPLLLTTVIARRARPRVRLKPRVLGSAALDLCLVAQGVAAASLSLRPKVWDHAAGRLLVTEAGGAYVTVEGDPLLPLEPGLEYAGRSAVGGAGPSADYVRRLAERLVVDGSG
ncbi:MAG: inositol monophosphatase [Nitriliruptorales bacterium]|nr:inositol monophosphatase [Nitriliruptorales bacterium]